MTAGFLGPSIGTDRGLDYWESRVPWDKFCTAISLLRVLTHTTWKCSTVLPVLLPQEVGDAFRRVEQRGFAALFQR